MNFVPNFIFVPSLVDAQVPLTVHLNALFNRINIMQRGLGLKKRIEVNGIKRPFPCKSLFHFHSPSLVKKKSYYCFYFFFILKYNIKGIFSKIYFFSFQIFSSLQILKHVCFSWLSSTSKIFYHWIKNLESNFTFNENQLASGNIKQLIIMG